MEGKLMVDKGEEVEEEVNSGGGGGGLRWCRWSCMDRRCSLPRHPLSTVVSINCMQHYGRPGDFTLTFCNEPCAAA